MLEYTEQSRRACRVRLAELITEIYNIDQPKILGAL